MLKKSGDTDVQLLDRGETTQMNVTGHQKDQLTEFPSDREEAFEPSETETKVIGETSGERIRSVKTQQHDFVLLNSV